MEQKLKKEAWVIHGLVDRLKALILEGALLEELKDDTEFRKLYARIKKEFAEELPRHVFNLEMFKAKVLELVWSTDRLHAVTNWVNLGMKFEGFAEVFSYIPEWMFEKKKRELRGKKPGDANSAIFRPGVGRLTTTEILEQTELVDFPEGSIEDPFEIEVANKDFYRIIVVNSPKIGLRHPLVLTNNPAYNVFGEAELTGADVVFATGGFFHLNTKRASGSNLRVHVDRWAGIQFAKEVISAEYADEAQRIHDKQPWDEVVFETIEEQWLNLKAGYGKITHDAEGEPKFSGPIILQLGYTEEELLEEVTRYHVSYVVTEMRAKKLAKYRAILDENDGKDTEVTRQLWAHAARMRVTNVRAAEHRRFFEKLRAFFVRELEEAIGENCTVIGMGSRYVKMGEQLIDLYQVRKETATENNLGEYVIKKGQRYTLSGDRMADLAIVAGPNVINSSWAVVEHAEDNRREAMHAIQPPVLIDKDFVRGTARDIIRVAKPFEKLIRHEDFEPGVLGLEHVNGLWVFNSYPIPAINRYRERRDAKVQLPQYVHTFVDTDPHFGHAWKTRVYCPACKQWHGLGVAVICMMRRAGLFEPGQERIHAFHALDDGTQGHNFATEYQPHENVMPHIFLEQYFNTLEEEAEHSEDAAGAIAKLREMKDVALEQDRLRGESWPQRQLDQYIEEMVDPNADFYASIIRLNIESGVEFRGVSAYLGKLYDARDVTAALFLSGNHWRNTVWGATYEGNAYAYALQRLLAGSDLLDGMPLDEVKRYVSAPKFGNDSIAYGVIADPSGYEWGLVLRAQPSKRAKKGDPIRNAAKQVREMGDYTLIHKGRHVLHVSGDIHRYGYVALPDLTVLSCASGTETDPYGARNGFSLNNTGNMIYSVPVMQDSEGKPMGPAAGPIRVVPIMYPWVRDNIANPSAVDWERVLPNPV